MPKRGLWEIILDDIPTVAVLGILGSLQYSWEEMRMPILVTCVILIVSEIAYYLAYRRQENRSR